MAQIGAWASKQSTPLESRMAFEKAIARYTAKFGIGTVPRPPFWSGYRVAPVEIEFWQERLYRLHDRIAFTARGSGGAVDQDAALSVNPSLRGAAATKQSRAACSFRTPPWIASLRSQ